MEDKTPKQKKSVRRSAKASGSPIPCGPTGGAMDDMPSACGHMACTGGKCNVRYVGPVSQIRDHHIVHAARHASHVWSAAIVTGLAVVLTGSLGYAAFGAESSNSMYGEFQQINNRLDRIEGMVKQLLDRGQVAAKPGEEQSAPAQCVNQCRKEYGDNVDKTNACIKERCGQRMAEPTAPTSTADMCKSSCEEKYSSADLTEEQRAAEVKACVEQSCTIPVQAPAPTSTTQLPTGAPAPTSTTGTIEQCNAKCYNTRVSCFKAAGSNYNALRECVAKESSCKAACAK